MVSQLFNQTWICKYPYPNEVTKRYFITLINYLSIRLFYTMIKNPQSNTQLQQVHQVIYNILFTKYLDNKLFEHIYPQGETLAYISWEIIESYHHPLKYTPGQYVLGRNMIINLKSIVDWIVTATRKKREVNSYNVRKNSRQVRHDNEHIYIVYVDKAVI